MQNEEEVQVQDSQHQADRSKNLQPSPRTQSDNEQAKNSEATTIVVQRQYNYEAEHDWKLHNFNTQKALQQLNLPELQNEEELPYFNDVPLAKVIQTTSEGSNLNQHTIYVIQIKDKNGQATVRRRYREFMALREKLTQRWPGYVIPPMPNTTLIGNTVEENIKYREAFINNFLRKLSAIPDIYYSDCVQSLLKSFEGTGQLALQVIREATQDQILQTYRQVFPEIAKNLPTEDYSVQLAQQASKQSQSQPRTSWGKINHFLGYFRQHKLDLNRYRQEIHLFVDFKLRYFKAMSRIDNTIVPEYEQQLLDWFDNVEQKKDFTIGYRNSSTKNEQEEKRQTGLMSSKQYHEQFMKTAEDIMDYLVPFERLQELFKFQQKQIDCIIQSINSCNYIRSDLNYLIRNIKLNQEQIESLNNKKNTLKLFFLGGTQEEKRSKLTNETKDSQVKLQKTTELYHIIKALLLRSISEFHEQRLRLYRQQLSKSLHKEAEIVRKIMGFHCFGLQQLRVYSNQGVPRSRQDTQQGIHKAEEQS